MGERDSGIWVPPGGSADPPRDDEAPPPPPPEDAITPEELAEQLRRIRVSDVVLSLLPTLAQLGYAKLDAETRDLAEARVAIDAMRALMPVLEGAVPDDLTRDYRQVITNMQLAYASAADEASSPPGSASDSLLQEREGQAAAPAGDERAAAGAESGQEEASSAPGAASDSLLQGGEGQAAAPAAEGRASASAASGQEEAGAAAEDAAAGESAEG